MNQKQTIKPTSGRTTYLLACTVSTSAVKLDFKSRLALAWINAWIEDHKGLKAPLSGVIRQALLAYAQRLEGVQPSDAFRTLQELKSTCRGTSPPQDEQDAAYVRLQGSGGPLKPFNVILHGQHAVDDSKALMKRLAVLNEIPQKVNSNE